MKIVSQLQNTEPNAGTKSTATLDSVTDFRDALATAKAGTTLVHGTNRKADKAQTADQKKKTLLADPSTSNSNIELFPTPKAPSLPPTQVASTVSSQTVLQSEANPTAFPSVGDITASAPSNAYAAQSLNSTSLVDSADPGATIANVDSPTTPAKPYENATAVDKQQSDLRSLVLQPDQSLLADLTAAAAPSFGSFHPDALSPVQIADDSKMSCVTSSSTAAGAHDSSPPAVYTTAVVTASIIAASISLPGLISNSEAEPASNEPTRQSRDRDKAADAPGDVALAQIVSAAIDQATLATPGVRELSGNGVSAQTTLPVLTGISPILKSVGTNAKNTPPLQVAAAAKSKPKSPSSEVRDSGDDDKISAVEPTNVTEEIASLAKTLEVTATPSHSAGDLSGASNALSLQQSAPTSFSAPDHSLQTTQIAGSQIEAKVPSASGNAPVDSQAMQGVTSAQLTQSMGSSEMKLGMQSAEFGNISITTSLNRQAISAQISIDHSELGRALAVHLPAIEEKLGSAYGVQAKVELRESYNPASSSDSGYSNQGQQSRDRRQSEQGGTTVAAGAMFERTAGLSRLTATSLSASDSRLDIRI